MSLFQVWYTTLISPPPNKFKHVHEKVFQGVKAEEIQLGWSLEIKFFIITADHIHQLMTQFDLFIQHGTKCHRRVFFN